MTRLMQAWYQIEVLAVLGRGANDDKDIPFGEVEIWLVEVEARLQAPPASLGAIQSRGTVLAIKEDDGLIEEWQSERIMWLSARPTSSTR